MTKLRDNATQNINLFAYGKPAKILLNGNCTIVARKTIDLQQGRKHEKSRKNEESDSEINLTKNDFYNFC
jgi:hypothetical protein